ncbi:CubicO group peptidase (beta-lactamase class C family) [Frigoribacterium sp. PvP120]|uniref:serine hydrolase domain-containing protein n=1 Tax=unclassified Frigoribacterium TaxID=2627005 RepID=UPI001AE3AD0D|nr:serine hydrolase domain-containing protein [Frigoribacterium sp. PvP121]MBP1242429.1 CubicO group peptidase (beta-lactamase class C family) [Frigoribacterium sp. PvP121]
MTSTTTTLPTCSPSDLGVDARGLLALVDGLEATPGVEPHGLVVVHRGAVVARGWWAPYSAERPHLVYSVSKSFTATAVGIAADEGLLTIDDTVVSWFPELDAEVTDERTRRMRLRHLLAMASGHLTETLDRAEATDPTNVVRGFLLIPPEAEPGSVFAYNQPCTYTLGEVVRRASGASLVDYLRPRLLDPLGIDVAAWQRDATGAELGFSGLHTTTDAVAALGQLHLQQGRWGDEQLVSPAWVAEASRSHASTAHEGSADWQQGYGFQFWVSTHGYRADGAYGQFSLVVPEHDLVVAITSQTTDTRALLDLVWATVLPSLGAGGSADDDARLAERLGALTLPGVAAPTGHGDPLDGASEGTVTAGTWTAADADRDQPSLSAIEVTTDGTPTLTLVEGEHRLEAALGLGEWRTTGSLATWAEQHGDRLLVDVVFVETPHRLHLVADSGTGTVSARWETAPLHGPDLRTLRAPGPDDVATL